MIFLHVSYWHFCTQPVSQPVLYGSQCWPVTRQNALKFNTACGRCLVSTLPAEAAWCQVIAVCFQCRSSRSCQSLLTSTNESTYFSLFSHKQQMVDNINAKKILSALAPEGWKRLQEDPRITWLKNVQNDLKSHNVTLTEAVDTTQNRSQTTQDVLISHGSRVYRMKWNSQRHSDQGSWYDSEPVTDHPGRPHITWLKSVQNEVKLTTSQWPRQLIRLRTCHRPPRTSSYHMAQECTEWGETHNVTVTRAVDTTQNQSMWRLLALCSSL